MVESEHLGTKFEYQIFAHRDLRTKTKKNVSYGSLCLVEEAKKT